MNLLPFFHQRQQQASAFFYVHLNATRLKEAEGFHVSAVLKSPKRAKKEDEDGRGEKRREVERHRGSTYTSSQEASFL